jgi:DNA-binding response OmpR family regulator
VSGRGLIDDDAFVRALRAYCGVVLAGNHEMLMTARTLESVDALVLDARGTFGGADSLVQRILRRCPTLPIVLINGGLSEQEKVEAFSLGVQDYFPDARLVGLLVERLEVLARGRPMAGHIELGE